MMGHSYLGLLGTVRAGHCSLIPRLQFGKKISLGMRLEEQLHLSGCAQLHWVL